MASTADLQHEVLKLTEAQEFPAAVAACRSLVVQNAELFGVECLITVQAISLLALTLDYIGPEGRSEGETWAHIAFCAYIQDVMTEHAPYKDFAPDSWMIEHIQIMRAVYPDVWDRRDTFRRTGVPDYKSGALLSE